MLLIEDLSNASKRGHLQESLTTYTRPHALIDEVGYLTYGPDAAHVLFHVVNDRHLRKRPMIFTTNKPLNEWERYYTTKIWQRPSSIGFSSAGALSISMDPRGEPVISTWNRPCFQKQNGSEFPELVAQIFRNPQLLFAFEARYNG
jgi:IstB-like ATP binding protein